MTLLSFFIVLAACFVVACRIDKMLKGVTKPWVFIQHAALGLGLLGGGLLSFTRWADLSVGSAALGVLVFFVISRHRWRHGAPEGTSRPMEMP